MNEQMGKMKPTQQTPEELERECMGTIISVCRDIERNAGEMDAAGVKVQFEFLKKQMARLDMIRTNIRRKLMEF